MLKMTVDYHPSQEDNNKIKSGIIDFNDHQLKYTSKKLSIFLRDDQNQIQGGVTTWLDSESIYIEILWVSEKFRGQQYGSQLLRAIETEAKKNGCKFSTLDTFGFQAEEFYLKNGYEVMGEIKNYIREYSRIFLRKKII